MPTFNSNSNGTKNNPTNKASKAGMPSNLPKTAPAAAKSAKKPLDEIVKEVIDGAWGAVADRKAKLEAAGYDYNMVQRAVNRVEGASVAELTAVVDQVIRGEFGNGADRKAKLEAAGFFQYEISNFSKKGYESRHNLKYWSCEEYLGFGPAAYSDFAGDRFGNSRDMRTYLDGGDILAERERPDERERENEYVMLRMRLCDGVSAADFRARFGKDLETYFGEGLSRYLDGGFVQRRGDGYAFTPKGMYVSNTILSDVLEF